MCDPVTRAVECIGLIENEQAEVPPFGCEPAPDSQRRNARIGAMEELRSTAVLDRERYRLERAAIEVLLPGIHAIAIRADGIGVPLGRGSPQKPEVHVVILRDFRTSGISEAIHAPLPRCRCSQKPGAWIWSKHEHRFDDKERMQLPMLAPTPALGQRAETGANQQDRRDRGDGNDRDGVGSGGSEIENFAIRRGPQLRGERL